MCDGRGRALATRITPGQAADTKQLMALLDQIAVAKPGGVGRPRKRPDSVTADKAYSSRANRAALRARGIVAVTPQRKDQIAHRARKDQRGFGRRKQWRGPATRYDKLGVSYQATVDLAETLDWLRAVPDHTP